MQYEKNLTPLMRQYWDIKSLHADKVLMFRMGDFFEMFYDDAILAAPILGIALTSRNKKAQDETPMCGMPHHSISGPINKLLALGHKVAICDQIEDPKLAKGIVKRAVTRVLTPGMVYDSDTLNTNLANYMASFEENVFACVDTTTGEAFYFVDCSAKQFQNFLEVLPITEMVTAESIEGLRSGITVSVHTETKIQKELPKAAQRLLSYIESLGSSEQLKTIGQFEKREIQGRMDLSFQTLRHLEVFTSSTGEEKGSFLNAINRTKTSSGSRLLRSRLQFPLTQADAISARLDAVEKWYYDPARLKKLREVLATVGDLERRLGKISQPQCNARDLQSIAQAMQGSIAALKISQISLKEETELLDLANKIENTIVEAPSLQVKLGEIIQKGVSTKLDELIRLATDSQSLLAEMEAKEKDSTGISSLKIRYNNVFGFYIEVTHTHKDKVPKHYMRKQTLANAERFYTEELVELEKKVLSAQMRRNELEFEIFTQLRESVIAMATGILNLAKAISELDVNSSLAWLAIERNYVRPKFLGDDLQLTLSRHPVVEQFTEKSFVANDLDLKQGSCLLLTGPNMAGKSTLMRQAGLISILAQMGSFVPCQSANLPIFDQVLTRIGAQDQLSQGLSTFMVEMKETAELLQKATNSSLLILDEIGRGTSTYDGMSLAQAILEYILKNSKGISFFATHYHELTDIPHANLKNAHMSVAEKKGDIEFLYTLAAGPAQRSYGIQVAKLAGLPAEITRRAEALLKQFEQKKNSAVAQEQMSLLDFGQNNPVLDDLEKFPINKKTPIEALQQISAWQEQLKN